MIIVAAISFVLIMGVIVLFASPRFSPIPYFPSNSQDMSLIVKALKLREDQTIYDLGAGDGVVVLEAARMALSEGLNSRFVAVEINPILVSILHIRRLLHPNRKNIYIVWGDLFKLDYRRYLREGDEVLVYIYVTPRLITSILEAFRRHIDHFTVVSYYYSPADHLKPTYSGVHDIYIRKV